MRKLLVLVSLFSLTNTFAMNERSFSAEGWMKLLTDTPFNAVATSKAIGFLDLNGGMCNGSLISENLVITNAHCVMGMNDCKGVLLQFYDNGGIVPTSWYKCEKIVVKNPGKFFPKNQPGEQYTFEPAEDFAILKFYGNPGFDRDYLEIAPMSSIVKTADGSFGDKIWRVKFDPPTVIRTNVTVSIGVCEAKIGYWGEMVLTQVNPKHPDYDAKEVCHSQQGNSGGSVLNEKGQFIGMIAQGEPVEESRMTGPSFNIFVNKQVTGPTIKTIDGYIRKSGYGLQNKDKNGNPVGLLELIKIED